jgi:hypothetical protein
MRAVAAILKLCGAGPDTAQSLRESNRTHHLATGGLAMVESSANHVGVKRLAGVLIFVLVASFAVLLIFGNEIYQQSPPTPDRIVTTEGVVD